MSTYTAFHIKNCVASELATTLSKDLENFGSFQKPVKLENYPEEIRKDFILRYDSGEVFPSLFAIEERNGHCTSVLFNCFGEIKELANILSQRYESILVTHFQSVSDAYYIAIHRNGSIERLIYHADGELLRSEGIPYDFEEGGLGTDVSEEKEEPYYLFSWEDAEEYCKNAGFKLWEETQVCYYLFRSNPKLQSPEGSESQAALPKITPWWKFWA